MSFKKSFFVAFVLLLSSCLKQSEKITPIAEPTTLAQLQREAMFQAANSAANGELSAASRAALELSSDPTLFYLNLKYQVKELDVFESAGMPNAFEQIGHSFLAKFAKLLFSMNGPKVVDIAPIDFTVPDLNLDKSVIKSIEVKSIQLRYSDSVDRQSDYNADFSFINSIELARQVSVPKIGIVDSLYFTYYKNQNNCLFKCLQFNVVNNNLMEILTQKTAVKLKPFISIIDLPKVNNLTIDGVIEMRIGLKLPF